MRFAANLTLMFTELPFFERFPAAADAGFPAVEILFPYDQSARQIQEALDRNNQRLVLINAPPPADADRVRGFGAVPGAEAEFRNDLTRVLDYARQLNPDHIHIMAGYTDAKGAEDVFVSNLQWAADQAPHRNFTIEPLNRGDQPGYFLADYEVAANVLSRVGRPNVQLQYDSYHAQTIHGDALAVWNRYHDLVGHVQIGDTPGRSEPGTGTVDFAALFEAIEGSGYSGWISAEYTPSTKATADSLDWMN